MAGCFAKAFWFSMMVTVGAISGCAEAERGRAGVQEAGYPFGISRSCSAVGARSTVAGAAERHELRRIDGDRADPDVARYEILHGSECLFSFGHEEIGPDGKVNSGPKMFKLSGTAAQASGTMDMNGLTVEMFGSDYTVKEVMTPIVDRFLADCARRSAADCNAEFVAWQARNILTLEFDEPLQLGESTVRLTLIGKDVYLGSYPLLARAPAEP